MVERFELERFEWQTPDRLEVAGRFHGLQEPPAHEPVLVISGGGAAHRLNAVPEMAPAPPEEGKAWRAQFVWDEAPVGVEAAALEMGPDLVVDLPPPGAKTTLLRPDYLDVRHTQQEDDAMPADPTAEPETEPQATTASGDIALQADLLAAEQEAQELRSALTRAQAELERARSDIEAERSGRAADAERFREGLAQVRASAEQALAGAQADADQRDKELRDARAALEDSEVARVELGRQLEAAETTRAQAEREAEALQQRLGPREAIGADADELRADAQRLMERVTKLVDVLDTGK
jgi:hypothetical protein